MASGAYTENVVFPFATLAPSFAVEASLFTLAAGFTELLVLFVLLVAVLFFLLLVEAVRV